MRPFAVAKSVVEGRLVVFHASPTMSGIGVIGALFSVLALSWAFVNRSNGRLAIFMLMMLMHIGVSVIYYYYVQAHDADTRIYYSDPYGFFGRSGTGTYFTINLVQTMRLWIG